jgi:uncharacterized protein
MSDRIERIDALRGWALLGIAVIHFMEQFLGAMPPPGMMSYAQHGIADRIIEGLGFILIRGKGFALFSFLFGLSFALQMQHAEARNPEGDFRPRFAWRLVILGIIGGLHGLLYGGDILLIYAVLGLPMLFFYKVPDRWLIALGLLLILGAPRLVYHVASPAPTAAKLAQAASKSQNEARQHWDRLTRGSFVEVARSNASSALKNKIDFQLGFIARGYQTFGLFLLGLWAGRNRLFENVEENLSRFRRAFRWTVGPALAIGAVVLAGMIYAALRPGTNGGDGPPGNLWTWPMVLGITLYDAWNFLFTVFYVAFFVLVSRWARAGRWLLLLAPVGRMALTNYLLQTIFGSLLFMGFGLGLLGTVGNAVTLPIGLAFFCLCAWVSTQWLKVFRFGPLEWLWRSLTLLKVQPFKRA